MENIPESYHYIVSKLAEFNKATDNSISSHSIIYDEIKDIVELVDPNSEEFKKIHNLFNNTDDKKGLDVENIYKINHPSSEYFTSTAENNLYLLWHGTKWMHLMSILKNGLRTNPAENDSLYFADMTAKALYHTDNNPDTKLKDWPHPNIFLLCKVNLGNMADQQYIRKTKENKPPEGFNSYKIEGGVVPDMVPMDDGVLASNGEIKQFYGGLKYCNYSIFDRERVKIEYLVLAYYGLS